VQAQFLDSPKEDNKGNRNLKRVALIVAVTDYTAFTPLNNPVNDGRAMYKKLSEMGFVVDTLFNPTISEMNDYLTYWQREKLEHAQQALFYFAGHGFSIKNENYLVPKTKEFDFTKTTQVETNCVSVRRIIDLMEEADVPIQLLILDACRDYARNVNYDEFGKNPMYSIKNDYAILYSTRHGFEALDGPPNTNSFFAQALIKYINDSRYSFSAMIDAVIDDVYKATGGKQKPKSSNGIDHFCFASGTDCKMPESQVLAYAESVEKGNSRGILKPDPVEDTTWNNSKTLIKKGDFYAAIGNMPYALACYERAANLKNPKGYYKLGCIYLYGNGVERNYDKAFEYFKKGGDFEDSECLRNIGLYYSDYFEYNNNRDYDLGLKYFKLSANLGNGMAMINVGQAYRDGTGVAQNYTEAMNWYRKSLESGCKDAIFFIACLYKNGEGVEKNYSEAMKLFKHSSEFGNKMASFQVGLFYKKGLGLPQDYSEAFKWFKKAAELGDSNAMFNIGLLYEKGQGVAQDYAEAMKWFKKAAELGSNYSMNNIGTFYEKGRGVAQDYAEAMKWYLKAAESGNTRSMTSIGDLYKEGKGVQQDYAVAMKWYLKSC
jgi:TPR repeat protein